MLESELSVSQTTSNDLSKKIEKLESTITFYKDSMDLSTKEKCNQWERVNLKIDTLDLCIGNVNRTMEKAQEIIKDEQRLEKEKTEIKKF